MTNLPAKIGEPTAVRLHHYIVLFDMQTNVLWMYNLYTDKWKKRLVANLRQEVRKGLHMGCCATVGEYVYAFLGDFHKRENDIWKLIRTKHGRFSWEKAVLIKHNLKKPSPRSSPVG